MRAHPRGSAEHEDHGIDLAPMLDFVLNLLIFFIITTSFVKEAGVRVDPPAADTALHRESGNILIAVRENGEVWMERQRVDLREVRSRVERMHVERPEDTVVILAERGARAGLVGELIDEVRQGGIQDVALGASVRSGG